MGDELVGSMMRYNGIYTRRGSLAWDCSYRQGIYTSIPMDECESVYLHLIICSVFSKRKYINILVLRCPLLIQWSRKQIVIPLPTAERSTIINHLPRVHERSNLSL
jgi:hypothetical protein